MKTSSPAGPVMVRCLAVTFALGAVMSPMASEAQYPPGSGAVRPVYDQWTTYLNPRFSYEVPVPPGLRAQNDPRRGSSCRFVSDDGALVLKVWGSSLSARPGDPLEDAWQEAFQVRGRRIDFQRRGPGGFVVAGVNRDGSEFYQKVISGVGSLAGFNFSYPPAMVARFAPFVEEIERGFGWHSGAPGLVEQGSPLPPSPRDSNQTKVDLTPPPEAPEDGPAAVPLEKPEAPPPAPANSKPAPGKREDLPYGIAIPGKKGYVYSPWLDNQQQVDVTDIPTGTKVKCPYTGKVFRVP